jgi:hypothetical protein
VTVYPNNLTDTALINYKLKEYKWWGFGFNLLDSFEGGVNQGNFALRNLR